MKKCLFYSLIGLLLVSSGCRKPKRFCNSRNCFIESLSSVANEGTITKVLINNIDITNEYLSNDTVFKLIHFGWSERKIINTIGRDEIALLHSIGNTTQWYDIYIKIDYFPSKKEIKVLGDNKYRISISDTLHPMYYHQLEFNNTGAFSYYSYKDAVIDLDYGTIIKVIKLEDNYIELSYLANGNTVIIGITNP